MARKFGTACACLFGIGLCAAGVAMAHQAWAYHFHSSPALGKITRINLTPGPPHESDLGTSPGRPQVEIDYEYQTAEGETHPGSILLPNPPEYLFNAQAGSPVNVLYLKGDPSKSLLEENAINHSVWGFSALLLGLGSVSVVASLDDYRKERIRSASSKGARASKS